MPEEPTEKNKEEISEAFNKFIVSHNVTSNSIRETGVLLFKCLKNFENLLIEEKNTDFTIFILEWHGTIKTKLKKLCVEGNEEQRQSSFETLLNLLPAEVVLDKRIKFPIHQYAELIKIIILSDSDVSSFLLLLKDILIYEDMSRNIWKALSIAVCEHSVQLSAREIVNVMHIINCVEKPKSKHVLEMGPSPSYCKLKEGVISDQEIEVCIKMFWNKISGAELSLKEKQMLLLVLYEQLMPRMTKPVFLIDFLMTSLNAGGPVGLLALQGIFTLIQKYNMNYPDVYKKIYSMLDYYIFDTQYKSRFYYLTDMFLSSSHLPEALVAGFIKKFARLSLTAPPIDIIIMMTFIVNLMIRHSGLKKLMHKIVEPTCIKADPYDIEESDPALSRGIDSSLWEVKIIQQHVLPSVSSSAMFVENPLPAVERDLSVLLDLRDDEIFGKELKKKVKNPPVSFEKPNSLTSTASRNGTNLWCFVK